MVVYILIALLLLSLISAGIRDYLKKNIGGLYMIVGGLMGILFLSISFLVYPKLPSVSSQTGAQVPGITDPLFLAFAVLMNMGIFIAGWKYKHLLQESDRAFYIAYILLILSIIISIVLMLNVVIAPIKYFKETRYQYYK